MKTIDCALAQDLMPLYTEGRPDCCAACGGGGKPCGRR